MPRKPTPETGRFELRATPEELRAWQAAADAEDRSLACWFRRLAALEVTRKMRGRANTAVMGSPENSKKPR
jgi:predicted HicB family RNase H-like nuclease